MKFYHVSRRKLTEGTILTVGVYGERISRHDFIENQYKTYIKEEIFESIRARHYPDLPSRLNCVFLYGKLTEARESHAKNTAYKGFVYEVEIKEGQPLVAEMDLLNCEGLSYQKITSSAHKYWSKTKHYESTTLEVLFNGKALVRNMVLGPSILVDIQ
jgi:hypothetical protein